MLGEYMRNVPAGVQPFVHINPSQLLLALRTLLQEMGVPEVAHYNTKAFRRGHTEDLLQRGGRLGEILGAGDWSSKAFAIYINKLKLERDRVAEAHCGKSDPESSSDSESEEA